eukprot:7248033-Karenia_brevis.AAC.1
MQIANAASVCSGALVREPSVNKQSRFVQTKSSRWSSGNSLRACRARGCSAMSMSSNCSADQS